jgi:hypothetical protein
MSQLRLINPLYICADPMKGAARGPAAPIFAAAFSVFVGGTTVLGLTSAASFLLLSAAGLALNALAPKPKLTQPQQRGYQTTAFGPALDHQVIYGETRIAGARVFDASTERNNKFLHRVIAFAGHEVEEFTEVYLNDYKLTVNLSTGEVTGAQSESETTSRYNNRVRIIARKGTDNQAAIPQLVNEVSEWTSAHRLRGVAYLYIRFEFDANVFPNGVPEITATIKGKKVFDPRTGATAWSDNPALCVRDYLTNSYGLGATNNEIDDVLVAQGANVCEETVEGENRYTLNGAFTTDAAPADTIQNMLTSMGGLLWHAQGAWRMKPAYYTAPVLSITSDDLRAGLQIQTRASRRDNFNTVRGTFRGEESNWQVTDYKPVTDSAFVDADGGFDSSIDLDFSFTTSHLTAQRIARIALQQQREQITVSGRFGLRAFSVQVGDNVIITNERLGWIEKQFEVVTWTFTLTQDLQLEVLMTLRETSPQVFVPTPGAAFESNNTELPSAFMLDPPGAPVITEKLYATRDGVGARVLLDVQWEAANDAFVDRYRVEARRIAKLDGTPISEPFEEYPETTDTKTEIRDVESGRWEVRVKAINVLGISSIFATSQKTVFGLTAKPQALQSVTLQSAGGLAIIKWSRSRDLDVRLGGNIVIRHNEREVPTWQSSYSMDSVDGNESIAVVPLKPGNYLVRPQDSGGRFGPIEILNTKGIQAVDFSPVDFLQADTAFSGEKDNLIVVEDSLRIAAAVKIDDYGLIDNILNFDNEGGIAPSGVYSFATSLDFGEVKRVRLRSQIELAAINVLSTLDERIGNIDTWIDFDETDGAEVDCVVEFRQSDDAPSGSEQFTEFSRVDNTEIEARLVEARAIITTGDPAFNASVTKLRLFADEVN